MTAALSSSAETREMNLRGQTVPSVDVVIVNWNTGPYLRDCVMSLADSKRHELRVRRGGRRRQRVERRLPRRTRGRPATASCGAERTQPRLRRGIESGRERGRLGVHPASESGYPPPSGHARSHRCVHGRSGEPGGWHLRRPHGERRRQRRVLVLAVSDVLDVGREDHRPHTLLPRLDPAPAHDATRKSEGTVSSIRSSVRTTSSGVPSSSLCTDSTNASSCTWRMSISLSARGSSATPATSSRTCPFTTWAA